MRAREKVALVRVDVDTVRRLVAGGVRFSHENGFRLPPRYERWTSVLGGVENWESADVSDFGAGDGRLQYIGTLEDLERRLIGCTVEQFMAREDVEVILGGSHGLPADDAGETVDEVADDLMLRMTVAAQQWCFRQGIPPHPQLPAAVALLIESMLQLRGDPSSNELDARQLMRADRNVETLMLFESVKTGPALAEAMDQLGQFVQQFGSSDEMIAAIGKSLSDDE